ncbi:hypothetical protein [Hymenobacter bucti]|uniref:Macroglobulin domain-containing protein n=1 Tax=Hymenobacter bucti TaxID=1844114 RepID=A0ABW4QVP1_9BACT
MRFPSTSRLCSVGSLALGLHLAASTLGHAQLADPLTTLSQSLEQYSRQTLTEQLFLHLDRPAYVAGETLWFKAYAVDGTYHRPLALSKVAYVEVLDAAQRPVLQAKIGLVRAMGQGALELPAELATGRYVVRAYTSWMKNAGPDFYFQCPITVVNTQEARPVAAPTAGPAYDVQFFPEGGQLVQDLQGRVAFKITDRQGHSVAATGTVAAANGATAATFQTLRNGLGSFLLTPTAAGGAYTATVRLPGGATLTSKLPAVAEQGYALRVTDASPTELTVAVQARLARPAEPLRLLAHTGQQVVTAAEATLLNGRTSFKIDKRLLRPGITHLTLFSGSRPVAERLYFRRPTPAQLLAVRGSATAQTVGLRSQVQLQVGTARPAALSLAVYRLDSLATSAPADISSYLLLAADLRGYIEDAGYYLRDSSAVAAQAADNLMLTQGWRRFRWDDVLAGKPPTPAYPPEVNGYLLQGRVRQRTGAPAPGVLAYLSLPGQSFWFGSSTSHADGLVQFEVPQTYGLRKLVLQTNTTLDSIVRVELLSPFTAGGGPAAPGLPPLARRWASTFSERLVQAQVQQAFPARPRYSATPLDTVAFYGRATEHYRLDDYTRFPTLEDVMREYVPGVLVRKRKDGFHFLVTDRMRHAILQENPLTLLDGLPVFDLNQLLAFDPLKLKTLDVVDSRYLSGQQMYEGVVSFQTYKGDLAGYPLNPHALLEEYELLQVPREFYAPRYDSEAQQRSRPPDLRNLLYWNPTIDLAANKPQMLNFFTSDQAGRYLVVVQGLTPDGHLGSTSFSFEVKPAL